MKKTLSFILALCLTLGVCGIAVYAADDAVSVYVTISDKDGSLAVAREKVNVTDKNNDKKITIYDALYCAHDEFYKGGAAAGFNAENTEFGLSLLKLWGTANGGSYGYYVNDTSAMSLLDNVKADDDVCAFVYTDLQTWSDTYSFFDVKEVNTKAYDYFELTLSSVTFDYTSGSMVKAPVKGAAITVDGKETRFVTNDEGKVRVCVTGKGEHVISAQSDSMTLVPPVCKVQADSGNLFMAIVYYISLVINAISSFISGIFSK